MRSTHLVTHRHRGGLEDGDCDYRWRDRRAAEERDVCVEIHSRQNHVADLAGCPRNDALLAEAFVSCVPAES